MPNRPMTGSGLISVKGCEEETEMFTKNDVRQSSLVLLVLLWAGIATSGETVVPKNVSNRPGAFSHAKIRKAEKIWVEESEKGDQAIKDLTAYCVKCHGHAKEKPSENIDGSSSGVHSHPVNCAYPPNGVDLVPITELDKRMLLIDGEMTCITCHNHDDSDHRLVIPDTSGKLCTACHQK